MADLNARIKPKKSSTTGEVPQAADLEVAEIAVNTADGKLFVKHTDDSIKEISGGTDITTESIDALSDVDTTTAPPADGQVLTWVDANSQWEAATSSGGGSTTLAGLTDVTTTDFIGGSVYQFDPLPLIGDGATRVILNPHGTSSYVFAGYGVWNNGHASIVGGTGSSARACINLNSAKKVFFGPTPISGTSSTDHTIEILASGAAGAQMRYRVQPTLGTGTADTVVPTMGRVREEFDAAGMRAILGIGEYADDTAAGTGGVASGAMYFNTTFNDYRAKS